MATKPRAILLLLPWTLCASSLPGGGNVTCDDSVQCGSVQSLSRVRLSATPWTAASQASLSIANSQSLLRLTPFESVIPSNHLILFCPPEGAFVSPSRRTLRPGATPQPPAPVASSPAGSQKPAETDPSRAARLPAGPRRRPRRWRSPALLFPLPSGRVPPTPARRLGTAPAAPGRLACTLSSCLTRRGASGVRRRRG